MSVTLSRASLATFLVLGLSSAALAREAGSHPRGVGKASTHQALGFNAPSFRADMRAVKDQPYTWPVSDRYRPISQPYYGRAY
ncbi:hypothetical protein MKK88_00065 [Methylobacterium sp. E-005]|uniref:hypothetical protein n=1 Tax=Methylobacterium sp. E-005 TaxID=2836549 RepID=UPI001FBAEC3C|nr:hypothetical protein [Methylobacterium sp. E-005]MCJ2084392.1 hypothetical protein [Methylobacterium sp. E-005]